MEVFSVTYQGCQKSPFQRRATPSQSVTSHLPILRAFGHSASNDNLCHNYCGISTYMLSANLISNFTMFSHCWWNSGPDIQIQEVWKLIFRELWLSLQRAFCLKPYGLTQKVFVLIEQHIVEQVLSWRTVSSSCIKPPSVSLNLGHTLYRFKEVNL